ncbi:MAG: aldo/keto reductase [Armatimonadota bacterium]
MEYRRLGKTELQVSPISFGAIKLPGISEDEAAACLNRALDLGVNFIDTARNYKDSERKIGLGLGHRREDFYLATKTGARDYDGAMADLETSLDQLQMEYIDIWQLHTVSNEEDWQRVMAPDGALKAARQAHDEGVVGHVSITIHRAHSVMRKAIDSGEFETIMLCFNPLDSEDVAEILPLAKQADMGTIIMKALSGGQLVYPKEERQAGLGGEDALVAGSLRWVLSNPHVDIVIPGMKTVQEVEENVALMHPVEPLSDAEREELLDRIAAFGGSYRYDQKCLRCGYCQPCPQGVPIPDIFKAAQMVGSYPDTLRHMGYDLYESLETNAEACVVCGVCLQKCPAGIEIPRMLEEAHEMLAARS